MNGFLNFDDGTIALTVNGSDRVFRFNPTDPAVYEGFMRLVTDAPRKMEEVAGKYKNTGIENMERTERIQMELKALHEADEVLRAAFDDTFGTGQSSIVYGTQNVAAVCKNGEYLFVNALMAIMPYFEKEGKKRSQKVRDIIKDHKPKK